MRKLTLGLRHDLLIGFFAILATLALIPIITYVYFASDLTSKEKIMNRNNRGVILTDKDDIPFFTFYQAKVREEVSLSQIPKTTQQAFIAMEDKDFYSHPGFSVKAIVRSAIQNLQSKEVMFGGSTITQQLVKNSLLTPKKEFMRKYQELVLATEIERRYSKDEILEMYLNSVYLGEGSLGVEDASQLYFNKDIKDLNLAESAILAAILPSPSRLSLINGNFDEAKKRQELVLDRMVEQKYITEKERDEAKKDKINLNPTLSGLNQEAPHFALMVIDQLKEKYGEEAIIRLGIRVRTTLNLEWQKKAVDIVSKHVESLKRNKATNGAAVVLDPKTGEIRAMVGSKDWFDDKYGKVNITTSSRSPGSSFKPIVYIRALERHLITPATILHDSPTKFANFDEKKFFSSFPTIASAQENLRNDPNAFYSPQNYDKKFRGNVTVRRALANSLNVPAVEIMKKVGIEDTIDFAEKLGITTIGEAENYGLSLVLGSAEVKPLEITNVYATFANHGFKNTPASILEIKDKSGRSIYKYSPKAERVIDEKYTFLISSILSDNAARFEVFGNALNISRPAAVKTGTGESYKDAWTIGYTPSLAVGVWVGNNFGEPMDGVAGSLGAAPIWKQLIKEFLKGTEVENFIPPQDVVSQKICIASSSARLEYFEKGTEPKESCKTPTPKEKRPIDKKS